MMWNYFQLWPFNSLTTKEQTTKFSSANSQKILSLSYIILRIERLEDKQCRSIEVAHYEPPHQDLRCLKIQLCLSLVLKELSDKLLTCLINGSMLRCSNVTLIYHIPI